MAESLYRMGRGRRGRAKPKDPPDPNRPPPSVIRVRV